MSQNTTHCLTIERNIVEFSYEEKDQFNQINKKLDRLLTTYMNICSFFNEKKESHQQLNLFQYVLGF